MRGTSVRGSLVVLALTLLSAWPSDRLTALLAQCPDGTPPPCRQVTLASPRRDSPLDERAWLILPFSNTTGASDAAVLTQTSVSLLYQDLARWRDIRVVSDDRVADLLRELPAGERDRPGLQSGLMLARRVGAGNLLLGDFLAVGGRAQLTAKVYEVRSGRQLRLAREQITALGSLDSLTAGFGRLARRVLAVPSPTEVGAGAGTASLEAYRAYAAGLEAMNRIELDSAVARFSRAVAFDSTFALARLRLWQASPRFLGPDTIVQRHLEAALRLANALPPRERALVTANGAQRRGDYDELCRGARELVRTDSTDAEGWGLLSACLNDTRLVVTPGSDSMTAGIRGNLTASLAAARRAAALSTSGMQAAAPTAILQIGQFRRCLLDDVAVCPARQLYAAALTLRGDSVTFVPRRWSDVRSAPPFASPEAVANYQERLRAVREIVGRLGAASPGNWLISFFESGIALQMGDVAAARSGLERALASGPDSVRLITLPARMQLALARGQAAEAAALAESVLAVPALRQRAGVQIGTMIGRFAEGPDSTAPLRQNAVWRQIMAGVLPAGLDTLEAAIAARLSGPQLEDFLQLSTLAAFRMRHAGPALDTAARHPIKRFQAWSARGDSARARGALAEFDRELLARHPATPDDGGWLFSAESHLELGDSAAALERMTEWERRWPIGSQSAPILEQWYWQRTNARLFGRMWLFYGDLAMAAGRRPEARRAYQMVIGLWEHGDPPVQPMVARARAALGQLGS